MCHTLDHRLGRDIPGEEPAVRGHLRTNLLELEARRLDRLHGRLTLFRPRLRSVQLLARDIHGVLGGQQMWRRLSHGFRLLLADRGGHLCERR